MLLYLFLQFCETVKSIKHGRNILNLPQHKEAWFLHLSVLQGLCVIRYKTINHDMLANFVERWHKETSSFHIHIGEMSITIDDISCLIHLPIRERLLNHSRIFRVDSLDIVVTYLGNDSGEAQIENDATRGAHAIFSYLGKLYKYHLDATVEAEDDDEQFLYHR